MSEVAAGRIASFHPFIPFRGTKDSSLWLYTSGSPSRASRPSLRRAPCFLLPGLSSLSDPPCGESNGAITPLPEQGYCITEGPNLSGEKVLFSHNLGSNKHRHGDQNPGNSSQFKPYRQRNQSGHRHNPHRPLHHLWHKHIIFKLLN